jgi:hypothetical protein
VSGGLNPSTTYSVRLAEGITFTNGLYATAKAKGAIRMVRPLPEFYATVNGIVAADTNYYEYGWPIGGTWLHFGQNEGDNVGVKFIFTNAPVKPPSSWLSYGDYFFVQTINVNYRWNTRSANNSCEGYFLNKIGLDTTYPYGWVDYDTEHGRWGITADSPGVKIKTEMSYMAETFNADMFLMFDPQSGASIPVPMYEVSWLWAGRAKTNGLPGDVTLLSSSTSGALSPTETFSYPIWTDVSTNQVTPTSIDCHEEN